MKANVARRTHPSNPRGSSGPQPRRIVSTSARSQTSQGDASLRQQAAKMLPVVEAGLRRAVAQLDQPATRDFHRMLTYHMGWTDRGAAAKSGGKRVRPLLLLLACASSGGRWQDAVPAAVAIEIAHNFSLIHDDIQDNSPSRRGRPALWTIYGTPLSINAGDALFAMTNSAVLDQRKSYRAETVVQAATILVGACLDLTRGQFLDLNTRPGAAPSLQDYWRMVEGKTAALISACTAIGAILAGVGPARCERFRLFGLLLGLAFQVQDDILGIWGDEQLTGKSADSDLDERKLSLPVVYGLRKRAAFAARWNASEPKPASAAELRQLLTDEGARSYAVRQGERLTARALATLASTKPQGAPGTALVELTRQLLGREH